MRRRAVLGLGASAGAGVLVGACGFRPVYMPTGSGRPGTATRELAAIEVGVIPDRPGQLLRQALQDRLEGSTTGVPRLYDLSVDYSVPGEGLGIRQDNSVTRVRLTGRASWTLRAQTPQRPVVTTGSARVVDDYNVIDQQYFGADLENETAQRRIANAVADQIALQLAVFFRRRALASGS
jgi:LPS-assembly lipoprotein